jgi:nucleotidyltransferase substrate binding protein (TIGR01987 family)
MLNNDIRWEQRFNNFRKALSKLEKVVLDTPLENLSELEKEGLIQRFEYTYELAWKTLQDVLRHKGYQDISGPNPVLEQAFQDGYIEDGHAWKLMKKARELSSHTYDEETAENIAENIIDSYYHLFKSLELKLEQMRNGKQSGLFES